ncbi:diaminopimelate decarboxylase, partial [Streptomyces bauhiniae]|nr:diaminopimelate decarboxylase [Streptomyces bauhiniae]
MEHHDADDAVAREREAAARVARRDAAVRGAVTGGLLGPDAPLVALLDVAG